MAAEYMATVRGWDSYADVEVMFIVDQFVGKNSKV